MVAKTRDAVSAKPRRKRHGMCTEQLRRAFIGAAMAKEKRPQSMPPRHFRKVRWTGSEATAAARYLCASLWTGGGNPVDEEAEKPVDLPRKSVEEACQKAGRKPGMFCP
jgi:hypothetical protein